MQLVKLWLILACTKCVLSQHAWQNKQKETTEHSQQNIPFNKRTNQPTSMRAHGIKHCFPKKGSTTAQGWAVI